MSTEAQPLVKRRFPVSSGNSEFQHGKIGQISIDAIICHNQPTDCLGTYLNFGIGSRRGRDIRLKTIYQKKEKRGELGSGDSLVVFTFATTQGMLIVADLEDGFSPVNRESWADIAAKSFREEKKQIPYNSDVFFSMINHDFISSPEIEHWFGLTAPVLDQLPSTVKKIIVPNHPSPIHEIALKEIVRQYLEQKNTFRRRSLGTLFQETEVGKELANGIFGVSALYIPNEVLTLPELETVGMGGSTLGGFACCRSLADIVLHTTFPENILFRADANSFLDFLFYKIIKPMMTKEQFSKIKELLYSKIDQIYAAFNATRLNFPLTEEAQLSGAMGPFGEISISGATDGAIHPETREFFNQDIAAPFLGLINGLKSDPKEVLSNIINPQDDLAAYSISVE